MEKPEFLASMRQCVDELHTIPVAGFYDEQSREYHPVRVRLAKLLYSQEPQGFKEFLDE